MEYRKIKKQTDKIQNSRFQIRQFGFTLIELLVVISIIGILATLIVANLNSARSRARDAERKSDLKNIEAALRLYYNDYGTFPANDNSYQPKGCGLSGITSCTWGGEWNSGSVIYMQTLPADPLSSQTYRYTAITTNNLISSFTLQACLENASDPNGVTSVWCASKWMFQVTE
jgi:general secretion pathway protein G